MKKVKENWIGEQCREIDENLRKNNSKTAYQLVEDLTTVKQGKAASIEDRSAKCLTEEREILKRWTEHCSELYNHKADGDPSVLNCPNTHSFVLMLLNFSSLVLLAQSTTKDYITLSGLRKAFIKRCS